MITAIFAEWQIKKRVNYFFFTYKEQQAFLEDFYALVKDGVTANQAIETIYSIAKSYTKLAALDILEAIASGQNIADGMRGWFPYQVIEVIRAGENSGALLQSLQAAAASFNQRVSVIDTLFKSLTYPIGVFVMSLVILILIKQMALTNFMQLKPINEWPLLSQHVYYWAQLLQYWGWLCLVLLIALMAFIAYFLHNITGELRQKVDQLVLFSWYKDATAARFMESLGLLINNGLVLKRALSIMQSEASPYMAWHLLMMEHRLSIGKDNIADVLDTELIREDDLIRLRIIAKGKGFAYALVSLGQRAKKNHVDRMARLSKMLGFLLLVASAGISLLAMCSIYMLSMMLGAM